MIDKELQNKLQDHMLVVNSCKKCDSPHGYTMKKDKLYFHYGCPCKGEDTEQLDTVALEIYLEDHHRTIVNLVKMEER